jgi:hypothetical protein
MGQPSTTTILLLDISTGLITAGLVGLLIVLVTTKHPHIVLITSGVLVVGIVLTGYGVGWW